MYLHRPPRNLSSDAMYLSTFGQVIKLRYSTLCNNYTLYTISRLIKTNEELMGNYFHFLLQSTFFSLEK